MIEVQSLTRYYGHHAAVQDVSFSIGNREIVGFLGLNGAGKSTTLKVLAGLLLPSDGQVSIGGVDALAAPDSLRERIGFLPEEPPLYREMTVVEFLMFCGQLKGMARARVRERLPEVLKLCDAIVSPIDSTYARAAVDSSLLVSKHMSAGEMCTKRSFVCRP